MANTKSAAKSARKNITRTNRNRAIKSGVKTTTKDFRVQLTEEPDEAPESMQYAASELDRAAKRGVIHKNAAARRKSRMAKQLAALKASS